MRRSAECSNAVRYADISDMKRYLIAELHHVQNMGDMRKKSIICGDMNFAEDEVRQMYNKDSTEISGNVDGLDGKSSKDGKGSKNRKGAKGKSDSVKP